MTKNSKGGSVTFDTLAEFYADFLKPQFDKLFSLFQKNTEDLHELKTDMKEVKTDINELKTDMGYVKDELKGIKAELSDTPSRKEFNALKVKVFA